MTEKSKHPPDRGSAWLWLLAGVLPFYLALTLAAAAAKVWPADAPPFFHQALLAIGPWLPGAGLWNSVMDLRKTFMDGRFQAFMPILLALLGAWVFTLSRAKASRQALKESRRLRDERSMMDDPPSHLRSK